MWLCSVKQCMRGFFGKALFHLDLFFKLWIGHGTSPCFPFRSLLFLKRSHLFSKANISLILLWYLLEVWSPDEVMGNCLLCLCLVFSWPKDHVADVLRSIRDSPRKGLEKWVGSPSFVSFWGNGGRWSESLRRIQKKWIGTVCFFPFRGEKIRKGWKQSSRSRDVGCIFSFFLKGQS